MHETIIDGDVPLGSLPQTGTLWMPVQILAVVGILLFSIGWLDLALAVMIFGNWKPLNIAGGALLFGLFKCIAASYPSIDITATGSSSSTSWGLSPALLPAAALPHHAAGARLHLQELPRSEGGGRALR